MKQKIIKIIKRIIGKRKLLFPIVDTNIYESTNKSFSGHSLQDSNVLLIGNDQLMINKAEKYYKQEGCSVRSIFKNLDELNSAEIEHARSEIIGHFDHIVNIIAPDSEHTLFRNNHSYNNKDIERIIYQWLQVETDYLDKNLNRSSLHVVFIKQSVEYINIITNSIINMVRGLSRRLLVHGIVTNGIVANNDVPQEIIAQALMFVSSKYGEVIAGEFIELEQ